MQQKKNQPKTHFRNGNVYFELVAVRTSFCQPQPVTKTNVVRAAPTKAADEGSSRGSEPRTDMNAVEKKLADLIREHPNLYDHSRQDYKDAMKGHVSWKEIAESMGKSEEEVKLKWKNLRDKFCKAKKRIAKRSFPRLTDDESAVERPVPVLYHQLSWLNAFVKPKPDIGMGDTDEVCVSVICLR